MAASYFFYDLETSGFSPTAARIMQFAGQRTDEDLNPVGEPVNVLIKLAPDVLPEPDAIMLTGITPQSTIAEGLTEAEFLDYFYKEVVQPDTTFLGFNTVRFDDEFMRFLHYRNFYDPYEWQWANGCSRWDILDLVRMTRALRPEGIEWPVSDEGKPTNRLELLTKANNLDHDHAHDALSDVHATIAIAKLVRDIQPDLFKYLRDCRGKKQVTALVEAGQPFVYTSGRFPGQELHTTVAFMLAKHSQQDSALVYDLRHDPTPFFAMTPEQLVDAWSYKKDRAEDDLRLPVKTLKYNRCPAIAPLGVVKDPATQERLGLSLDTVQQNLEKLKAGQKDFTRSVLAALELMDNARARKYTKGEPTDANVDAMLYDGFFGPNDKQSMRAVRVAQPEAISDLGHKLSDKRLQQLVPLYKARNYPQSLSADERQAWEQHISGQLFDGGPSSKLSKYFARLQQLASGTLTSQQEYILEELQLYGESVMPSDITEQ
ncbi:MAG: Exodeoxyribonuclease [Candidatus Saccharibacteria bacterium]|nr:Exodeoxyribonuclease [Candidatus Saccharibacteria bacterium]